MGSKQKNTDRALKRVRTEAKDHPAQRIEFIKFPKFLVLHSEDEKPLAKLSPFLVSKVLEGIIGMNFNAKTMASGDLLVETNTKQQSEALLALNAVADYKVSVTPHRKLNTIQEVISEDDLLETSEAEIVEGLSGQGVVAARRITIRRDGAERKTKHVILTFDSTTLPETLKAGYLRCRVRPYVPSPRRCFKCQRFGHGSRSCRGADTCAKCSSREHVADTCENNPKCANWDGPHPAYSRSCPLWKQEKEVLALKAK
uniref:Putative tick transposon n=1 Tax=Ixodes ricinus TaxID=34613 RepID=A0A6B0V6C2_IXORI